jgi:molecular chaperone GrpE
MVDNNTKNHDSLEDENIDEILISEKESSEQSEDADKQAGQDLNDKYLRLYAEFENYKKRVNKDKEELVKFANESMLYELLPAIDSLELALKHSSDDPNTGLVQGVEMTLKELHRTLEKFGLSKIDSEGKEFDPSVHHAMMNVEREDMDEKMVAEELRSGYRYHDKLLRPSLVAVSAKPQEKVKAQDSGNKNGENTVSDTGNGSENIEIKINKEIEEEE